jgi:hypothetical protein
MKVFSFTTFLIRVAVVFAFVASGWFVWYSARWLVGHDDIYLRLHDAGFGFITDSAEMFAFAGFFPALFGGLVLGILAAAWLTRRRASTEER